MVVLLIVSGVQMFMIGILGEYIWRNLDETRRRPRFIVERIIGNTSSEAFDMPLPRSPTAVCPKNGQLDAENSSSPELNGR
jgi:hypothetical protein